MIHANLKKKVINCWGLGAVSGDLGVELEIEGTNLPKTALGWDVHTENSLRGLNGRTVQPGEDLPDTPREYVTAGAVTLHGLMTTCQHLFSLLNRKDTTPVLTARASTHFHVNMQNMTLRTVYGFMLVYMIVEPVLLRLCGPARNGNLFCIPCYESGDLPEHILKCNAAVESNLKYWPNDEGHNLRGKYSAMNIDPIRRFGSIEIRCFPNAFDPETIFKWGNWLLNIRDTAQVWAMEDYSDLFKYALENPSVFLDKIFGHSDLGLWSACSPNNPSELVQAGVEVSYEAFRSMQQVFDVTTKRTGANKLKRKGAFYDEMVSFAAPEPEEDF